MRNEIYQQVNALDPRSQGVQVRDAIVGLVGVVLLFSCLVTLPSRDFSSDDAFRGVLLSVFLLVGSAILMSLVTVSGNRAHKIAFTSWIHLKKPTLYELARIAFSPEEHAIIRDSVLVELNKNHPHWRTQVAGVVAMRQGEAGDCLPPVDYGVVDYLYMGLVIIMGLAGFGLAFTAFITGNVMLSISTMICIGLLIFLIIRGNKKDQVKYAKWKNDVLAYYCVDDLIYLQALPTLKPEVVMRLHRLLGEELPGWSQRADVPLWAALCKCD